MLNGIFCWISDSDPSINHQSFEKDSKTPTQDLWCIKACIKAWNLHSICNPAVLPTTLAWLSGQHRQHKISWQRRWWRSLASVVLRIVAACATTKTSFTAPACAAVLAPATLRPLLLSTPAAAPPASCCGCCGPSTFTHAVTWYLSAQSYDTYQEWRNPWTNLPSWIR